MVSIMIMLYHLIKRHGSIRLFVDVESAHVPETDKARAPLPVNLRRSLCVCVFTLGVPPGGATSCSGLFYIYTTLTPAGVVNSTVPVYGPGRVYPRLVAWPTCCSGLLCCWDLLVSLLLSVCVVGFEDFANSGRFVWTYVCRASGLCQW